jgi:hypothetical protein
MNHYVTLALTNRKSSVHLHALYSPRTAVRMFTPRTDHLMVCLLYVHGVVFARGIICFSSLLHPDQLWVSQRHVQLEPGVQWRKRKVTIYVI